MEIFKVVYTSIILSKTGSPIPIFASERACHSKYNPQKEAEQFISTIFYSDLFIVLGIGGAFHINALQKKFPAAKIIAIEYTNDDIAFLLANSDIVKKTISAGNVMFIPPEKIDSALCENFIPAVYPTLSIVEWRTWKNELPNQSEAILHQINETIKRISQDFATQSKFGKMWQHAILKNIHFLQKNEIPLPPLEKTAIVLAAGPSLEKNIDVIKRNRHDFFVISTDTAYAVLKKSDVFCDVVVSIDGQTISATHFLGNHNEKTLFVFDISGNHQAIHTLHKNGNPILFSQNGHPLAQYIEKKSGKNLFFPLDAGNGTVTLSCVDFALKLGFEKIIVSGADFGYRETKTYARGTYLDTLYASSQTKTTSFETQFLHLYFRSNLIKVTDKKNTTPLLDSYRKSFEDWANKNGLDISREHENYILKKIAGHTVKKNWANFQNEELNFSALKQSIVSDIKNHPPLKEFRSSDILIAILPFISYLRTQKNAVSEQDETLINLALDDFMKYTSLL